MTDTMTYSGTLVIDTCWCGITFAVPESLKNKQRRDWDTPSRRRDSKQQEDGVRWEIRAAAWRPGMAPPPAFVVPKISPDQMEMAA